LPSSSILGDAGLNIAGMQVFRSLPGGEALVVLTLGNSVPADVLSDIVQDIGATFARSVNLH
jgi:D-3-phosphoglycerate dehydrogenase